MRVGHELPSKEKMPKHYKVANNQDIRTAISSTTARKMIVNEINKK